MGLWLPARNAIMNIMINAWEKQECSTVIASVLENES